MEIKKINELCKLIKKNLNISNKNNFNSNNKYFLIVDRQRYIPTFSLGILAANINKIQGLLPILISDLKKNHHISKIYNSFNILNTFSPFSLIICLKKIFLSIESLLICLICLIKINLNSFHWFIENYSISNILIGDLVYDSYVKNFNNYKNPKTDLRFILILFQAIFRTKNTYRYLKNKNIKFVLVGTSSYVSNGSIVTRIAINRNIRVIEPYFYGFREITKKTIENGYHYEFIKNNSKKINKIKKKLSNKFFVDRFIKLKNRGYIGKKDFYFQNYKKITKKLKKSELQKYGLNIKNYKKIILIACHAFSDAPHSLGNKFIFRDYYDFLIQTLNFISENNDKSILWLVKPHPSSGYYGEQGVADKIVLDLNINNIKLFPNQINTANAINLCDAVITGRGTMGIEFACHGKTAVTVGEAPYSFMKINKVFHNKQKYFSFIKNINSITKIKKNQTNIARKTLFFLENANRNFLSKSTLIDEVVLKNFYSNDPTVRRLDSYIINKKLIKNLKKNRILDDPFAKSFLRYYKIKNL